MSDEPAATIDQMLATALRRCVAAQLVLVFGSPDTKRQVERLIDGKLHADEAESARRSLDIMARTLLDR